MDSHVWRVVYRAIREVDRVLPRVGRRPVFSDVLIVAMYVWTVGHDRPLCWACDRRHYGSDFRPRRLPSVSQFCKRIKTERCDGILQAVHDRLARSDVGTQLSYLDGRALCVGAHSKDRDARSGPAPGGMAKGYRLHAWATEDLRIPIWSVVPLNVSEKTVAGELLNARRAVGVVLADSNYDAGWLYERVAERGGQLVTPLPENAGSGHRRQSPSRLAALHLWDALGAYVYRDRLKIERVFGSTCCFGGGLGPLPAWVRTLPRVRRWVGAKLIIYHARLALRRRAV